MNGDTLAIAAATALAAASLVRKRGAGSASTDADMAIAAALRSYRPSGSAARRKPEVPPEDFPGQERIPGFSDEELVARGLARPKGPTKPPARSRRRKAVDLDAELEASAAQALEQEMAEAATLQVQRQAVEAQAKRLQSSPPRDEGPWELFLRSNPSDVSDETLVALLIADGSGDPVARARSLLASSMGSVGQIVEGTFGEDAGVSEPARARLIAAAELSRRAALRQAFATRERFILNNPERVVDFLRRMSSGPKESLSVIYLDGALNVIGFRTISTGNQSMTIVSPVEIFRPAIMLRATAIIMAHQHPSGDPEPSRQDMEATVRLKAVGDSIGISLADHFVIGNNRYSSLRQMGLIR